MPGLTDNVMVLGNGNFNYFVVGKNEATLIECGTSAGVSIFAEQWSDLENKPNIKYILVMHSHFDHVCGIPMLKDLFPEAQVVGSQVTQKMLLNEKFKLILQGTDAFIIDAYAKEPLLPTIPGPLTIERVKVDFTLGEGDSIMVDDGLKLEIIEAPGHSACSLAAYLPNDQVMFISDSGGYLAPDDVMSPVFFQDYDIYRDTINRLRQYPTEVLGVGHGEVPVGADQVQQFYTRGLEAAEEAFALIKEKLNGGQSDESITMELYNTYIKGAMSYYPQDLMMGSVYQLVKNVKFRL